MVTFPIVTFSQRAVLGIAITFIILPVTAVGLRLFARRTAGRKLDGSDYSIIAAAILSVALESVSITGVFHGGIGYDHVLVIVAAYGLEPVTLLLKLLVSLQVLWALSLALCKISVLLLYIRVFPITYIQWGSRILIAIVVMWAAATILAGFLICQPFAMNWDQTIAGHCGDSVASFQGTGAINLITDVAVLLLPMHQLYQLHLVLYKKVIMMGVFSIGFLACIVSGFRISVLSEMDYNDITYTLPLANIFSGLEPNLAVTLACIPLLAPLLGSPKTVGSSDPNQPRTYVRRRNTNPDDELEYFNENSSQYQLHRVETHDRSKSETKGGGVDAESVGTAITC